MRIFLVVLMVLLSAPVMAQSAVTVDLAQESIDITTGFNGADLKLFGVRDAPGRIAVVITGPQREMVVRRKQRIFGVWANLSGIKFDNVPVYYDFALEQVDGDEESEDVEARAALNIVLAQSGIGLEALHFETEENVGPDDLKVFQGALIRNKQAEGRFPEAAADITFMSDTFFKTSFYIPADVPTGEYQIKTYLIGKTSVKDVSTTNVRVGQVGFSAEIYGFAKENGLWYGLVCVMFAIFMGWLSDFIRRRL